MVSDSSCSLCWFLTTTALVGFYGYLAFQLGDILYKKFRKEKVDLHRISKDGKAWAVVTGATDGIGKGFAFALAKRGFNIVLISRSEEKLNNVKDEIEKKHGSIHVMCVKVDFVIDEVAHYKQVIADAIKSLRVDVLINNVGIGQGIKGRFLEVTEEGEDNSIKCNIKSFSTLTRIVLPQMVSRKFGIIVNIASAVAKMNASLLSVYSGTKAYYARWSDILADEYSGDGIIVQTVSPGFVKTKMIGELKNKLPSFIMATPASLSETSLESLGQKQSINGHWSYALMLFMMNIEFVQRLINVRRVYNHLNVKKNQ